MPRPLDHGLDAGRAAPQLPADLEYAEALLAKREDGGVGGPRRAAAAECLPSALARANPA